MSETRATEAEVELRRDAIADLSAKGLKAPEIRGLLIADFPGITLNKIWDDIEHIEKHAHEYIGRRYLPGLGKIFEEAVRAMDNVRREAWRRYEQGEVEVHHIQTPEGTTVKRIVREGSSEWLKLYGSAAKTLLSLAERQSVIKAQARVMADYQRLLDKEKEAEAMMKVEQR